VLGGIALAVAGTLATGGSASGGDAGPDQQILDAVLALVPADADQLTDAQVGQLLDQMTAAAGGVVPGAPEGSSKLTGPCGGFAFSYDGDGNLLDAAFDSGDGAPPQDLAGGGQAFTSGNPFVVDTEGKVTYFGFTVGGAPENHTWKLSVGGVQVASGGDRNSNQNNRNAGTITMDDELPFPISAKLSASGSMNSSIPTCSGEGHVELNGNGLFGPIGLGGLALALIGTLGLLFNAPPARTWKG
jgi:hypothetical protein